ncbi:MAG: hypothetical protein K2M93_08340 [Muribaculaceae bacterium]|nr:hypothetical protein [Muribaculaceae bacterium]
MRELDDRILVWGLIQIFSSRHPARRMPRRVAVIWVIDCYPTLHYAS